MITIKNLHVAIEDTPIIKGLNLSVKKGEIHAIMGPNGSGKSTLAQVLAGHPSYEVTDGTVIYKDQNILELEPEERMHLGLFMTFQYPLEIPGVNNEQFLFSAYNALLKAKGEDTVDGKTFTDLLDEKMQVMKMRKEFKTRSVNEGFSGGEKKRNEILQMAIFQPEIAILDETDSGLDIDAIRIVAEGIKTLIDKDKSLILITHYQRLLDYIQPDKVHIMIGGKIVQSGDAQLALTLEEKGYDWVEQSSFGEIE